MRPIFSILIFLVATSVVRANAKFLLTDSSLQRSTISSLRFVDDSIEFMDADGRKSRLSLDEVLALDSTGVRGNETTPDDVWIAMLSDGSRVGGSPVRLEGDRLRWRLQAAETSAELTLDLASVVSVARLSAQNDSTGEPITEDCLRLKNGDVVKGIIDDITESKISIQSDGRTFEASRDDVTMIRLASVGTQERDDANFVLRLDDAGRSILRASTLTGGDQGLIAMIDTQAVTIDPDLLTSLRSTNGRAKFLVDCKVISMEVLGYFSPEGQPPKFDLDPARSIQTRSRTMIAYQVDGFNSFQTRFAVPPELEHANVTIRIRLDGKTVFEQANIVSGTTSDLISIELDGARELALETDFGENFDVQDRLIWLEPVLAR